MSDLFDERGRPKRVIYEDWEYGEPTLESGNNASANWCRGCVSPLDQKSSTGWLACLYGGIQTGDDWARVNVPVNEKPVPDFSSAKWSYYMTGTETMGVNIVIWVHDPDDFDKRAEITQLGGHADLEKAAGWNAFEFSPATGGMFFYGEGTTGTGLTAGTQYTWSQFQTDAVFKEWVIYRVTIEYGWEASGTFDDVWVADIQLNDTMIPLKPDSGGTGRIARRFATGATALATALVPKTPFKLLSVLLHLDAAATQQTFTVTCDAGRAASVYDTLLVSQAMSGLTDVVKTWEGGLEFKEDDEIDCVWTNTDTKTYGLTVTYQTVFA